jgi:hypothetical protein
VLKAWAELIHNLTDRFDDFDICLFVVPADVVDLANTTSLKNFADSPAVITYMQPVSNLEPFAIHGQWLAF